jgi:NitT/TauT family transport system ATP-binding protein
VRRVILSADASERPHVAATGGEPVLRVSGLAKRYSKDGALALSDVTFDVAEGELLAIVGASGCGKTTLLRLISGLMPPTEGVALLDGKPVDGPPREVAIVFQDYSRSLFPWLTVVRNVMFPLRRSELSKSERVARAEAVLAEMGLHDVASKYPWQLSGGMQQRVAIARALIHDPDLLLLDEPFASLDAMTRERMWTELSRIWQMDQKTVIMVTHSINESLFLADRVLVLTQRPGKIKMDVAVDLPRPRRDDIRYTPHFGKLARKLREAIE